MPYESMVYGTIPDEELYDDDGLSFYLWPPPENTVGPIQLRLFDSKFTKDGNISWTRTPVYDFRNYWREYAIARDLGVCQCCFSTFAEVHHIHLRYDGGSDHPDNLACLCYTCHRLAPNEPEAFEPYRRHGGAFGIYYLSKCGHLPDDEVVYRMRQIMIYFNHRRKTSEKNQTK